MEYKDSKQTAGMCTDEQVKAQLAKLQKQILELQDDCEDAEDGKKSAEKKLRAKTQELEELQNTHRQNEKRLQQLGQELEQSNTERQELQNRVAQNEDAMRFMQEILTAQEVHDVKCLNDAIASLHSFVLDQWIPFEEDIITKEELITWTGDMTIDRYKVIVRSLMDSWEILMRKSWLQNKKTVAFVGQFSAGKTSIVNRILSQDDPSVPLLPVSTEATTAIPTYIAGGPATTYTFVSPDDKQKVIAEKTFKLVSKQLLEQVKGVSSLIKYFVMTYQNPNLQGLSILDTPGFNSNDKDDSARTLDVINECDALFWVFDVNNGTVNRESLKLINEELSKPLYVVINKTDTKAKSEVEKVERLIRQTLEEGGVEIEGVIWFSKKEPLSTIMAPIQSVQHDKDGVDFLTFLEGQIKQDCETLTKIKKDAFSEYKKEEKDYKDLVRNIKDQLDELNDDCDRAADLPQWVEHVFSSDRYEMDRDEYECMKANLDDVKDTSTRLEKYGCEAIEECVKALQSALQEKNKAKAYLARVNELQKQFSSLAKQFN